MTNKDNDDIKFCIEAVMEYFKDDYLKALHWFYAPNPGLGGASAYKLILLGRVKGVRKFIETAEKG